MNAPRYSTCIPHNLEFHEVVRVDKFNRRPPSTPLYQISLQKSAGRVGGKQIKERDRHGSGLRTPIGNSSPYVDTLILFRPSRPKQGCRGGVPGRRNTRVRTLKS